MCVPRSQLGVGGADAHYHGATILKEGFSIVKASDVCCFEMPPISHKGHAEALKSNQELIDLSNCLIPPLQQVKYLTVGGGHTNTFLRAVKANCPTPVDSLKDANGRLDLEKLGVGQPLFVDAVKNGLTWLVMDWRLNAFLKVLYTQNLEFFCGLHHVC